MESIRALIETVGASSEQAMDLLEIKEQDCPEIWEALAKQRLLTELQRVRTVIPDVSSRENCLEL